MTLFLNLPGLIRRGARSELPRFTERIPLVIAHKVLISSIFQLKPCGLFYNTTLLLKHLLRFLKKSNMSSIVLKIKAKYGHNSCSLPHFGLIFLALTLCFYIPITDTSFSKLDVINRCLCLENDKSLICILGSATN